MSRKMWIWIIGILIFIGLMTGIYFLGKKHGAVRTDPELQKQIATLQTQLDKSKDDYNILVEKLGKKVAERKKIVPPKTEAEVRERSKALGYPPIR